MRGSRGSTRFIATVLVMALSVLAWVSTPPAVAEDVTIAGTALAPPAVRLHPGADAGMDHFGTAVAISGNTAVIGAPQDSNRGASAGSAHVFIYNGASWVAQQQLFASDAQAGDRFGSSVAVSGDVIVVGAPYEDERGDSAGAAYIFTRSGSAWTQQKVTALDGAAWDYFGWSVGVSGGTAVVGAPSDDGISGGEFGSLYVFTRSGASWGLQQKLAAADGHTADQLGLSVAIWGDTIVAGAPTDDSPAESAGSAYVFTRSGGTWTQRPKLVVYDGAAQDRLGTSVAVYGDFIVIGAPGDDDKGAESGSAYLFQRVGTAWAQLPKLTASDGLTDDLFGTSVALSGDTVLVGTPGATDNGDSAGAAYAFVHSGSSWVQLPKLLADSYTGEECGTSVGLSGDTALLGAPGYNGPSPLTGCAYVWPLAEHFSIVDAYGDNVGDLFGSSVAICGDWAVAGAPRDNLTYPDQGSASLMSRTGRSWSYNQKLATSDGQQGDLFGSAVAISNDTVVIGAPEDDDNGAQSGSAYVYTRAGATWSGPTKIKPLDGAENAYFGASVAVWGDTVVVGAPQGEAESRYGPGMAYVFVRTGSGWVQQAKLTAPGGLFGDWFGASVAVSGSTVLVGAPLEDSILASRPGSAYVFTRSGSTWSFQKNLLSADSHAGDRFGCSVSLSGETALVGAPYADSVTVDDCGAAYVFTRTGSAWSAGQQLVASDRAGWTRFGDSVAVSGSTAVAGAYGDDGHGDASGAAYAFTKVGTAWHQLPKIAASDGVSYDLLGLSAALAGGTVLVGVPGDDDKAAEAGSVYVAALRPRLTGGIARLAGSNRYLTSVLASQRGFPYGAPAVVIATGGNWPDALGGSALAGALHGPLLLTRSDALNAEVRAEIARLGASRAYILGSTAAVSTGVENALVSMLGRANVVRLGGANRYETAQRIADETIKVAGYAYTGEAFVATGGNFPDATAAAPVASFLVRPILLVNPSNGSVYVPRGVASCTILGSVSTVSAAVESSLKARPGMVRVTRLGGANRYETAALIAKAGVAAGMRWDGVGLATGENFPDALAGGAMLGGFDSVLLLTRPTVLSGATQAALTANAHEIWTMHVFGGPTTIAPAVEAAAKAAAGL